MTGQVTVLAVRHADIDQPAASADPPLNAAGRRRATALAHVAGSSAVGTIFTSTLTRTKATAEPLARRLGLQPREVPGTAELAEQVRSGELGEVVMIAGHSNTVPEMIHALGVPSAPAIGEREFDNLFVVTVVVADGTAALVRLRYGAIPTR